MTTPNGFALGLIPDEHDPRDRLYAPPPQHTPYRFVDLEPDSATPPVWDQKDIGSCTAHGTLACFLWASAKCGANDPMLSRLMLYWLSRELEGTVGEDSGAQIRDAIKASAAGICPEEMWPYDTSKFATEPPAECREAGQANQDLDYRRVQRDGDAIQACLSEGFPIDIGVNLFPSFEADDAIQSGVVPLPDGESEPIGGHCMAVWGIGTGADWHAHDQFPTADDATLYAKVRNSWGLIYQGGVSGYCLMPVDYLTSELGSDYWVIKRVS